MVFGLGYKMSLGIGVALCLGAVIGDTLFMFTGVPIAQAGIVSVIAYIAVGIAVAIISTQLGELSSIMPHDKGGAYSYVSRSFGSELGFITGMLLFVGYSAMISAAAYGFGGYFLFLSGISNSDVQLLASIAIILLVSAVNMRGIKNTVELAKVLLAIALLTVAAFVIFAVFHGYSSGNINYLLVRNAAQDARGSLVQAVTAIVFAYTGFQVIGTLADNIKGEGRAVVKVMVISLLIGIVAYVAVTIGLALLIPPSLATINANPLIYALNYANAPYLLTFFVGIGSLLAIAASMIAITFMASRLIHQIGKDRLLPKAAEAYDDEKGVATTGVAVTGMLSIALLFSGGLYSMLSISNFGIIFSWIMSCFALINFHRRKISGGFTAPYYPYLTVISLVASIIFMFGLPSKSLALGVIVILMLLVVYYTVIEMRYKKVPRERLFD